MKEDRIFDAAEKVVKGMTKGHKEEEQKPISVSFLETPTYLLEEVESSPGDFSFVLFNKETGKVEEQELKEFKFEDTTYIPDTTEPFTKRAILLPIKAEFVSEKELEKEMTDFITASYWLDDKTLFFARIYAKYSWIADRYPTVPYYGPVGQMGTGKTRHIDIVGSLCRKPLSVAGGVSESFIFRMIDAHMPTLIINEFDTLDTSDQATLTSMLNNGFEKGHYIAKSEGEGKNIKPRLWSPFGPKLFSTLQRFKSDALESRILRNNCLEFPKDLRNNYSIELPTELHEWVQEIQNKLLGFRLTHIAELNATRVRVNKEISSLEGKNKTARIRQLRVSGLDNSNNTRQDIITRFLKEDYFDNRTRQTFYPLLRVIREEDLDTLIEFAKNYQKELSEQRSESDIGIIANKLVEIFVERLSYEDITTAEVRLNVSKEIYGVNTKGEPVKELSPQKLGGLLRVMKLKTEPKGHDKQKHIIFNEDNLNFLLRRYVVAHDLQELARSTAEALKTQVRSKIVPDKVPQTETQEAPQGEDEEIDVDAILESFENKE
jgi:hypothetical protein